MVAVDINPRAVQNTLLNARRHAVQDRLRVVHSDLFDALAPEERFDVVYWHSNFVLAPEGHAYENPHDRAYVDAGYLDHERYLAEAAGLLTPGGRVLLHFSDRGEIGRLRDLAWLHGRRLRLLASRRDREGAETVRHLLYEVASD